MKIYYTARDIEEMAARGVRRLEIGPHVTLTDVARETAQAFNIELAPAAPPKPAAPAGRYDKPAACQHGPAPAAPASIPAHTNAGGQYNKPAACQHGPAPASSVAPAAPPPARRDGPDATTMNKLIDLVGKVMKRGG